MNITEKISYKSKLNREDKRKQAKLIELIYNAIFQLNNDDLLLHYYEVIKELEKRGVTTCSRL